MQPIGEIGNGRAAAILLARQGAKVALVDYNVEWARETKRMIDEEGGISEVIQADVTNEKACQNAVEKTVELYGAVHILINIGEASLLLILLARSQANLFVSRCRRDLGRCHQARSRRMGSRLPDQRD